MQANAIVRHKSKAKYKKRKAFIEACVSSQIFLICFFPGVDFSVSSAVLPLSFMSSSLPPSLPPFPSLRTSVIRFSTIRSFYMDLHSFYNFLFAILLSLLF